MTKVLIVNDDKNYVSALASIVKKKGFEVDIANRCKIASQKVAMNEHDLVFVDMTLPDGNGMDVVRNAPEFYPGRFYIMTENPGTDSAAHALTGRTVDYLVKPITTREIDDVLGHYHQEQKAYDRCARTQQTGQQTVGEKLDSSSPSLRGNAPDVQDPKPDIIGSSAPIRKLLHDINRLAKSATTVLLQGESGTGKKLVAQKIHSLSERNGQLHSVNCAAMTKEQASAELFGHEKASIDGVSERYKGIFERAHGGTLFLDNITRVPLDTQAHLLHALETATISPAGATHHSLDIDVRIIAATDCDLIEAVKEGKFREDLYFLLSETPLPVPALRDRGKDILVLARHFLDHLNRSYGDNKILDEDGKHALMKYSWPGNIKELNHAVHRAFLVNDDVLDFSQIAEMVEHVADNNGLSPYLGSSIADMEKQLILETLSHYDNDKPRAAEVLGISLKTLYNRLNRYNRPNHSKLTPPEAH